MTRVIMNSSDQFAENKDTSWSDSWTVLDSSHLKDDGDLSDAESVEVLESEGQSDENTVDEESEETSTFVGDTGVLTDSLLSKLTQEIDEGAPTSVDHVGNTAKANDNVDALPQNNCTDNSTSILFKLKQFFFKVERIEFSIPTVLLEIIWYSLLFDMLLVTYLGVSYLAGLAENHPFEALKAHKSHQQYELDPLVLQLSHVVAEWKKYPLDDHSLDRHMLKTLFLYYGGSTELSANLHTLTEKVQKHNELLKNLGKEHYNKDEGQHLMAVSGHLAHSVACILGKQDQIVVPADMYLAANHSNDQHQDFAPDPGFWLNDWHLPQYFKANNTYYRIDSKPFVPPMQNFFVNLGSAGWNHYFWNLYHGIKDDNLVRDETTAGITTEQISESELDVEETERSPLDSILGDEALSFEKSSKTVFEIENNRQDGMGVLNPLNDVDSGLEEVAHNDEFEALGNYFKVLNEKNYLDDNRDGLNNHECVDKWCRLHEESSTPLVGQSKRQEKALKTGKLIQLFEEVSEDNSRNEDVLLKAESKKPLSDDLTEFSDSYLLNKFENWQVFDEENKKAFGKGKLNKLFAEILQEESHTEDLNAARKTETLSKEKKIVDAFEESDTLKMRSKIRSSFNESQEERKSILKESKSKDKFRRENRENMKHRRKQKNKGKESYGSGKAEREVNKKRKKKNFQKELKSEVSEKNRMSKRKDKSREKININPNNIEDKISDWNTRMVKGREQLRAQSGRKDDEMWLFERAKARHDMREETFYQ